ncbi:MAG: hypothetical protein AB1473_11335 [Thermodesulfobacteriota bacterium]
MLQQTIGLFILFIFYVCFAVIVFAPTIYVAWLYVASRRTPGTVRVRPKLLVSTLVVNLILGYFLAYLAYDYFVVTQVAEQDATAVAAVREAIESERRHFATQGRYYEVGPVRGPYENEHGLKIGKNIILEVRPSWDGKGDKETFQVYAVHVRGRKVVQGGADGNVEQIGPDSERAFAIRSKLINSVK